MALTGSGLMGLRVFLALVLVLACIQRHRATHSDDIWRCEAKVMKLGSEIADIFNAPVKNEDWNQRVHQNAIIERLGFSPWLANGVYRSGGKTLTNDNAHEIHANAGWVGKSIAESPYAYLERKWIYMLGDSTTRQVWASYAAPFQGNHFNRNSKEWTRHYVR
jgi:hypothetical protein